MYKTLKLPLENGSLLWWYTFSVVKVDCNHWLLLFQLLGWILWVLWIWSFRDIEIRPWSSFYSIKWLRFIFKIIQIYIYIYIKETILFSHAFHGIWESIMLFLILNYFHYFFSNKIVDRSIVVFLWTYVHKVDIIVNQLRLYFEMIIIR